MKIKYKILRILFKLLITVQNQNSTYNEEYDSLATLTIDEQ